MINDKGFVDAYAAIYEKKEEKRWQDDDGDGKWYEKSDVDGKTSKREKDEKKSKKKDDDEDKKEETKCEEVEKVDEGWGTVAKVAATQGAKFVAKRGGKAAVKKAAVSGGKTAAKWAAVDAVANKVMGGDQQDESVQIEDAEGNVTAEVIDLVLPDPIKAFRNSSTLNKEEVEVEEDLLLESRLWDQVAANLTTLGEMRGIKYKVSPLEEVAGLIALKTASTAAKTAGAVAKGVGKAALSTVKKEEVDIEAASEQQSPFNVKSPVIFGKKIVEEETKEDLVSKYAPNIIKADASMKEGAGELVGSIAGGVAGGAVGGLPGGIAGSLAGGALGSKLDKKKPARKKVQ